MPNAYLVLGAESTGTRFVAQILRSAGCIGWASDDGGHTQQWDVETPNGQTPLVYHHSFPHGDSRWRVVDLLEKFPGYDVQAVVMVRDWRWMVASQQKFRTADEIENNLQDAYPYIFNGLGASHIRHVVVTYEALLLDYEAYARFILRWLGLSDNRALPELVNGNQKYHAV